ncbi:helix-turn-helix transcriptional regulator [Viridibacillus sp. FSL H8-0123]|uniref:helix-turn-helix transcriptional regulator n=1 Tax=Viridibacillus sp. FSL H8-0123 TaxID=1928922 RepID=UPI00096CF148|nr:helix-turn-helix transcriptional regulator [Viridibacillus sp. FSL H8-0123]OMC83332.1 hypothetical protein BK130_07220 [Viridibacillus sp. FSL H8-0123]
MFEKSADASKALQNLIENENLTNEQLALDIKLSPQMISHLKNGRRPMQRDIAQASMQAYENTEYMADLMRAFTSGLTTPVLRGKNIERHRMSLAANAVKEMLEAIEAVKKMVLVKPPGTLDKDELQEVENIYDEMLEATIFSENFLMQLENDYGISRKKRVRINEPRWKARGWLQ